MGRGLLLICNHDDLRALREEGGDEEEIVVVPGLGRIDKCEAEDPGWDQLRSDW